MIVKLLTLEFLSLKGGCRGSSESTLVKLLEISYGSYVKHKHTLLFRVLQLFFFNLCKVYCLFQIYH